MRMIDADPLIRQIRIRRKWWGKLRAGDVLEMIEEAPTLREEPEKRARWEPILVNDCGKLRRYWQCSGCQKIIHLPEKPVVPYCPWCGAKMGDRKR